MSNANEGKPNPDGSSSNPSPPPSDASAEKWGTKYMSPPAPPSAHPDNQQAATWTAPEQYPNQQHPYLYYTPIDRPPHGGSPMETILDTFNAWGKRTEQLASNIWQNLKMGPSVPETAWGKLSLTAKALTEGGFEAVYKETFQTSPGERLKKTFACYLSTSSGPVAGTLYLSNVHVAFCSDRPLCYTDPSGQQAWSYYKVQVPLGKISNINPVKVKENPAEKYIQIVTVDGHDFWFMGFVNYDKASTHLSGTFSEFNASRVIN